LRSAGIHRSGPAEVAIVPLVFTSLNRPKKNSHSVTVTTSLARQPATQPTTRCAHDRLKAVLAGMTQLTGYWALAQRQRRLRRHRPASMFKTAGGYGPSLLYKVDGRSDNQSINVTFLTCKQPKAILQAPQKENCLQSAVHS